MKTVLAISLLFLLGSTNQTSFAQDPKVYVVVFTHIEDNTPSATVGSDEARIQYLQLRSRLITTANLFKDKNVPWVFQPDWKLLLAALAYEDTGVKATTANKNVFKYLKENLNVIIDPHSHEKQGYNYTDVAHLLDSLEVGATKVIGGHVWDPSIPQFQQWDRFRVPVRGTKYPWATWRGDILMGSGTPNHVNDPKISGVWRPKNRNQYFVDDPAGNIVSIGQYKGDIPTIAELVSLYATRKVPANRMLTSSYHLKPSTISAANGMKVIEDSVITPLLSLRSAGKIKITDFTTLVSDWKTLYGSTAYVYDPQTTTSIYEMLPLPTSLTLLPNYPNPFNPSTTLRWMTSASGANQIRVYNSIGQLVHETKVTHRPAGHHSYPFEAELLSSGVYHYHIRVNDQTVVGRMVLVR